MADGAVKAARIRPQSSSLNVFWAASTLQTPGILAAIGQAASLDQLRCSQPHPLAAGPFCGGQPAAAGIPHGPGIAHDARRHQSL
jgi:hypothetical protein